MKKPSLHSHRVWLLATACLLAPDAGRAQITYDSELSRLNLAVWSLQGRASNSLSDAKRCLHSLCQRAALRGLADDDTEVAQALEVALARFGECPELLALQVDLLLRGHEVPKAKAALLSAEARLPAASLHLLRAELALQQGQLEEARTNVLKSLEARRSWDALARLAHLDDLEGDFHNADALYRQAEDEVTAKEMRAYAWLEIQRGFLHMRRGDHVTASACYGKAAKALPGYWLADAHIAELMAAREQLPEAIALYEKLVARSPKPELQQTLGDLYLRVDKPVLGKFWHERMLETCLASAHRNEARYYHHLSSFYADVRGDGNEALRWARADHALRQNSGTFDTLAWALYRSGQYVEALAAVKTALTLKPSDAHLLDRAGMIHQAAGRRAEASDYFKQAAEINPHYTNFHTHR